MQNNGECIQALTSAFDDLRTGNTLNLDKNLRSILKCLVYYPEFRKVLEQCNRNFNYDYEKGRSTGKLGNSYVFRLPKNKKTMVALVAGMLVEFDAGDMDIVTFACKYYPSTTRSDSFAAFYSAVLEPFKFAVCAFVRDGVSDEPTPVKREVALANDGLSKQTESLLVEMTKIVKESDLDSAEREEFTVMLEGFAAALDSRDVLMIKAIWYGLSRALDFRRLCTREASRMQELLNMYLLSK